MRGWPSLIVFLLLTFAAGFIGSHFLPGAWYAGLTKPAFNPPNWIFAPAWTLLYILMAVAAWRVWRIAGFSGAIVLWLIQLAFNAAWSWLFFGQHALHIALAEILCLLALIVATTIAFFRTDRAAGWLMVPYVAWVSFASLLNAALWHLNPSG